MNHPARIMSADDFMAWRQDQPGRWELVNGFPIRAMAFATQRHDTVTVNILSALRLKLRGQRCRPWSADIAVKIPGGNVRQPDVTIDCAPIRNEGLASDAPTVVFEVLSPSTKAFDVTRKLEEYKRVATLAHIVFIDLDQPRVALWTRAGDAWVDTQADGLDARIELGAVPVALTLSEIYEDLAFETED